MLGKLLKYEFKSTGRMLGIIYLVILVLSVVLGISGRSFLQEVITNTGIYGDDMAVSKFVPFVIMLIAYVILVLALAIITLVVIVGRFYTNMLTGEGYLMHTLPVPTWMLVAGKTISAFIWDILGGVVIILSLVIIAGSGGVLHTIVLDFSSLFSSEFIAALDINYGVWFVAFFIESIRLILTFYVSMAIGGAAKKHKKLFSVLAFICIVIVIQIISAVGGLGAAENFEGAVGMFVNMYMAKDIIFNAVLAVVFFVLTTFFLQKKLNLE